MTTGILAFVPGCLNIVISKPATDGSILARTGAGEA